MVLGWLISSPYTLIIVGSLITMTAPGDAFLVCFFSVLPCVNRLFAYRLANMFTFGDQREHLLETDFMLFCQSRKIWIKFLGNVLLKALGELNEVLLAGPLMTTCGCSSCMYGSKIWSWDHPAEAITDWSRHYLVSTCFLDRSRRVGHVTWSMGKEPRGDCIPTLHQNPQNSQGSKVHWHYFK